MNKIIVAGMLSLVVSSVMSAENTLNSPLSKHVTKNASDGQVSQSPSGPTKININQADVSQLVHVIKGIGNKRAESIVKYREAHGLFKSVADLAFVPGLGNNFVKTHQLELDRLFSVN
jgi:competence protein ComEA